MITQTPVTRDDVQFAMNLRNATAKMIGKDSDGNDLGPRILGCQVVYWTDYAMVNAVSPSDPDEMRQRYEHDSRSWPAGLKSTRDRFHVYSHRADNSFITNEFFERMVVESRVVVADFDVHGFFFLWDECSYTKMSGRFGVVGKYKQGLVISFVKIHANQVLDLPLPTYETRGPEMIRLSITLDSFLASKYINLEERKPPKARGVKSKTCYKPQSIVAVICRKPAVVKAQEEAAYREALERDGKSWTLQFESHTTGHVRNQWYPSIGEHRKISIAPFVRGNGKPRRQNETILKAQR